MSVAADGAAGVGMASAGTTGLGTSLLALAAMVLAMAVLPWVVRRWQQRSQAARGVIGVQGQVLHTVALGPGQRVVTVELERDGARVCLVLGVSPQHIQCLHVWPHGQAAVAPSSFAQALNSAPVPAPAGVESAPMAVAPTQD